MLCPAAALVLLLHHHGQAAHVFVILAIPYLIGMPRIDLGACFAPSGCLLVVTTGSNRPKAVIPRVRNQGRFIHRWFDMQVGGIPYGASANDSATIMHDDTT